jgi:hypothetical protein
MLCNIGHGGGLLYAPALATLAKTTIIVSSHASHY